jgi:hypothetical protein
MVTLRGNLRAFQRTFPVYVGLSIIPCKKTEKVCMARPIIPYKKQKNTFIALRVFFK